jgi:hypothetical protein
MEDLAFGEPAGATTDARFARATAPAMVDHFAGRDGDLDNHWRRTPLLPQATVFWPRTCTGRGFGRRMSVTLDSLRRLATHAISDDPTKEGRLRDQILRDAE